MTSAASPSTSLWERCGRLDRLDVLPTLTLLLLLIHAPDNWYLRTPLIFLCIAGIACRELLRRPPYWYLMALLLGTTAYLNWESTDNHRYVFVYWCLTLCAAFSVPAANQEECLGLSSRWLIGLCMLLATVWKGINPQYLSGGFFEYELLTDERFAHFTNWLTAMPAGDLTTNRDLRDLLHSGHLRGLNLESVALASTPGVRWIAQFLTWWTILIEGLLAVLFLLPDNRRTAVIRNSTLLIFAVSTYSVANIRGFGWMLMLLGMGQSSDRDRDFRIAYLGGFLLIQLYTFPFAKIAETVGAWR